MAYAVSIACEGWNEPLYNQQFQCAWLLAVDEKVQPAIDDEKFQEALTWLQIAKRFEIWQTQLFANSLSEAQVAK